MRLSQTRTGLSNLRIIDSPHSTFVLELKQHKFVENSQEGNKNTVSTMGSVR